MPEDFPRAPLTSLNTLKHGCRSRQRLLKHEDPSEWTALRDIYMQEYNPQTPFLEQLLEEAVQAHWFLKRTQTNLHRIQLDFPEDPRRWRPEDHHQLALFTRYQTAAERTFHRALARLQSHHKAQQNQRSHAPKAVKESKEIKTDPVVIEQWVEVRQIDGQTVTEFYPTNEELEQTIATSVPKPTLVYRRLFFPDGVPASYQWTRPREGHAAIGGLAIQRMTVETWLSMREKERVSGQAECTGKATLRHWRDGEPSDS